MSGTNKLIQSDNAMENDSIEDLATDLLDANNEALEELGMIKDTENEKEK